MGNIKGDVVIWGRMLNFETKVTAWLAGTSRQDTFITFTVLRL